MSLIREERPEDAEAVGAILVTAFGREAEARLVERLLRRRPLLT
jgi:predicted N-acetyltransferase YhbS